MDVQMFFRRGVVKLAGAVLCFLLSFTLLAACQLQSDVTLDRTDRHFAVFYSDYLIGSGVTSRNEDVVLVPPSGEELQQMLARHALTPEDFRKRVVLYGKQPERWKKVLVLVRAEIRKKRP